MSEPEKKSFSPRGLGFYGKLNISVKTLDKLIVGGIIAIIIVLLLGLQNRGYTVQFDSMGGTPVEAQKHMYGELLDQPEEPTREGYVFSGWYRDSSYQYVWNIGTDKVVESTTLYASWKSK